MILGFILGITFILISIPLLIWKIPPNMWYGFRTAKTLTPGNEEIWYKTNNFMAKIFIVCGIVEIILGYVAIYSDSWSLVLQVIYLITLILLPFIAVIISALYVKKL